MFNTFINFLLASEPVTRYVLLGAMLLTSSAAMIGVFSLLQKKALASDTVAHAVLPGLCLAFMVTGNKHPLYLILGASCTGWLALLLLDIVPARSKIKEDTMTTILLSVFFGVGMLLLTMIQQTGNAQQAGLYHFLFGKAASLMLADVKVLGVLALTLVATVWMLFRAFRLVIFDRNYAHAIGMPVKQLTFVLRVLTILAVVIGIQTVGIVLMAAMLITPAAAARFWTHRLSTMLGVAAVLGALSGFWGTFASYIAPAMPTGPWIVIAATIFLFGSLLFAPDKGLLARYLRQRRYRQKMVSENILKLFYEIGQQEGVFFTPHSLQTLQQHRPIPTATLSKELQHLARRGLVRKIEKEKWQLTESGRNQGAHILKLHLLWEDYLTRYLPAKPDLIHDNAEIMEHVISPELEQEIKRLVGKSMSENSDIP